MRHITIIYLMGMVLFTEGLVYGQQVDYHYFDSRDQVKIEYRWTRSNLFDRNSDAVLYLQITNLNDFAVHITFDLGFYHDEQLVLESKDNMLCLNPGQRRRGSRTDMRFSAPGMGLAMVESEEFSWDMVRFVVEEGPCK